MLFYVALAIFLYFVFLMVQPFLVPLGWAAVLVIVFHPVHARLRAALRPVSRRGLSTAAVAIIVVVPLLIVMTAFVREAVQATGDVQRAIAEGRLAWSRARVGLGPAPRGRGAAIRRRRARRWMSRSGSAPFSPHRPATCCRTSRSSCSIS